MRIGVQEGKLIIKKTFEPNPTGKKSENQEGAEELVSRGLIEESSWCSSYEDYESYELTKEGREVYNRIRGHLLKLYKNQVALHYPKDPTNW